MASLKAFSFDHFAFEGTLGIGRGNWDGNMALSGLAVNG
jgi:hypothetical protein